MKCTICSKEFDPGSPSFPSEDWLCTDGKVHVVEKSVYFMADAPMQFRGHNASLSERNRLQ
jgi:hypothetical protein